MSIRWQRPWEPEFRSIDESDFATLTYFDEDGIRVSLEVMVGAGGSITLSDTLEDLGVVFDDGTTVEIEFDEDISLEGADQAAEEAQAVANSAAQEAQEEADDAAEEAQEEANTAAEEARAAAEEAKSTAKQAKDDAKNTAKQAKDDARNGDIGEESND